MEERRSTPETVLATAHLNNMGRDEMNLAEFPLATLADRAPRGCKTLVFEDRIWDRGQGEHRVRRLTISASDKYGLPTAIDDEVILGRVQVSKAAGVADRRVGFSRYQLVHLLGWRDEGRSYRRLEHSLKRWLGVTLYYENAWWDKARKRWVDANFHFLEDFVLYHRPQAHAGTPATVGDAALSFFTWNEVVFRSFQAGFLKKLDLDFYRHLKLATAKRMYRFLDKRFHHSNRMRFDLRRFACEHIGLSRKYDAAQLKRRLNPAIAELEQAGFLEPLPPASRFRRLRRGEWEVLFFRTPKGVSGNPTGRQWTVEEKELVDRGVTPAVAVRLARDFPPEVIRAKLDVFDQLCERQDRRISRNPAGYLVKSIRENYLPPAGLSRTTARRTARFGSGRDCSAAGASWQENATEPQLSKVDRQVDAYLAQLSPTERSRVETEAVVAARGLAAEGLRRATAAGHTRRADYYRQTIVRQHVRLLLSSAVAAA